MKHVLVAYNYDCNWITERPMKSNKGSTITNVYKSIYVELTEAGITLILKYLDKKRLKNKF